MLKWCHWETTYTGRSMYFLSWKLFFSDPTFFFNFWRTWVLFVGSLIPLFWTSSDVSPGFQSQGGSLAGVLCHLPAMNSWDTPLVQHLLISWRPAWQLVAFPTCIRSYLDFDEHIHVIFSINVFYSLTISDVSRISHSGPLCSTPICS